MARPPKHPPELIERVKAYRLTMTVRQVAEKLGLPVSTVQWMNKRPPNR